MRSSQRSLHREDYPLHPPVPQQPGTWNKVHNCSLPDRALPLTSLLLSYDTSQKGIAWKGACDPEEITESAKPSGTAQGLEDTLIELEEISLSEEPIDESGESEMIFELEDLDLDLEFEDEPEDDKKEK